MVQIDEFPVRLRVLAVDDDPVGLKISESMLRRCEFHVTAASQAIMAIKLLREEKDQFDLVISMVPMPDMDGFKRLQIMGLEMDLPVIMMSAICDPKIVMEGITHGAHDHLSKLVRIDELKNIWQHILTRKTFSKFGLGDFRALPGQGRRLTDATLSSPYAPAQFKNFNGSNDPSAQTKSLFEWTIENRRKFFEAVKLSGYEKAAPERVLELMNVEGLTLEEVAIHLQRSSLQILLSRVPQRANTMAAALGDKDFRALTGQKRRRLTDATVSSPYVSEAAPERVLELMNVEGLTLEEVTSHLQVQRSSLQDLFSRVPQRANIMAAALGDKDFRALTGQKRRRTDAALSSNYVPEDHQMVFSQNLEYLFCKCGKVITLPQYFKFHGMAMENGAFGTVFEKVTGCYYMGVLPISASELLICKNCNQQIGYKYQSASNEINHLLFTGEIRVKHRSMVLTLEEYLPSLLARVSRRAHSECCRAKNRGTRPLRTRKKFAQGHVSL